MKTDKIDLNKVAFVSKGFHVPRVDGHETRVIYDKDFVKSFYRFPWPRQIVAVKFTNDGLFEAVPAIAVPIKDRLGVLLIHLKEEDETKGSKEATLASIEDSLKKLHLLTRQNACKTGESLVQNKILDCQDNAGEGHSKESQDKPECERSAVTPEPDSYNGNEIIPTKERNDNENIISSTMPINKISIIKNAEKALENLAKVVSKDLGKQDNKLETKSFETFSSNHEDKNVMTLLKINGTSKRKLEEQEKLSLKISEKSKLLKSKEEIGTNKIIQGSEENLSPFNSNESFKTNRSKNTLKRKGIQKCCLSQCTLNKLSQRRASFTGSRSCLASDDSIKKIHDRNDAVAHCSSDSMYSPYSSCMSRVRMPKKKSLKQSSAKHSNSVVTTVVSGNGHANSVDQDEQPMTKNKSTKCFTPRRMLIKRSHRESLVETVTKEVSNNDGNKTQWSQTTRNTEKITEYMWVPGCSTPKSRITSNPKRKHAKNTIIDSSQHKKHKTKTLSNSRKGVLTHKLVERSWKDHNDALDFEGKCKQKFDKVTLSLPSGPKIQLKSDIRDSEQKIVPDSPFNLTKSSRNLESSVGSLTERSKNCNDCTSKEVHKFIGKSSNPQGSQIPKNILCRVDSTVDVSPMSSIRAQGPFVKTCGTTSIQESRASKPRPTMNIETFFKNYRIPQKKSLFTNDQNHKKTQWRDSNEADVFTQTHETVERVASHRNLTVDIAPSPEVCTANITVDNMLNNVKNPSKGIVQTNNIEKTLVHVASELIGESSKKVVSRANKISNNRNMENYPEDSVKGTVTDVRDSIPYIPSKCMIPGIEESPSKIPQTPVPKQHNTRTKRPSLESLPDVIESTSNTPSKCMIPGIQESPSKIPQTPVPKQHNTRTKRTSLGSSPYVIVSTSKCMIPGNEESPSKIPQTPVPKQHTTRTKRASLGPLPDIIMSASNTSSKCMIPDIEQSISKITQMSRPEIKSLLKMVPRRIRKRHYMKWARGELSRRKKSIKAPSKMENPNDLEKSSKTVTTCGRRRLKWARGEIPKRKRRSKMVSDLTKQGFANKNLKSECSNKSKTNFEEFLMNWNENVTKLAEMEVPLLDFESFVTESSIKCILEDDSGKDEDYSLLDDKIVSRPSVDEKVLFSIKKEEPEPLTSHDDYSLLNIHVKTEIDFDSSTGNNYENKILPYCPVKEESVEYGSPPLSPLHVKEEPELIYEMEDLICYHCGFKTKRKDILQHHIKDFHIFERYLKTPKDTIFYWCHLCPFFTNMSTQYVFHLSQRHGRLYECQKCDFETPDSDTYMEHVYSDHTHLVVCPHCDHVSVGRRNLRLHIHCWHRNLDLEHCSKCTQMFCTRQELENHRKKEHPKFIRRRKHKNTPDKCMKKKSLS